MEPDSSPVYGEGREIAGVLGHGIHNFCVKAVRSAVDIISEDNLSLKIIGVGGVSTPEDAAAYFEAGADAVTLGSAPIFDPGLAVRIKKSHPEW